MAATARGRNRPSSMLSEAKATNSPLDVIWVKKSGPRPALGVDTLTVTAIMIGTSARMASPAWLRRRPKISRSSERRKRVETCRSGRAADDVDRQVPDPGVWALIGPAFSSAADIEALPRHGDEQVLEAGTFDREPAHRHALLHQRHHNLVRGQRAQGADSHTGFERNVAQPQSAQYSRSILGTVADDPGSHLADGSHLGDRSLCQQRTHMHHPDMGAHLLDLGQEMAGDQDRGPVVGQGADEVANLPGSLRVKSVGRLIEHQKLTWLEQGARYRE